LERGKVLLHGFDEWRYKKVAHKLYICSMSKVGKYITIDTEIQNGQPVFTGTRVPVQTLFWHLEKGISIEEFLQDFPSVTKEQAIGVLEIANKIVTSAHLDKIYETVN
jgi:uncharacterized protein (DUF433 family)